jgi:hypothetical protein
MGDRPMTHELLQKWLDKFGDACDAGPAREGWQSDDLLALIEQTREILAASSIRSCLLDKPEAVEGEAVAWRVKMSSRSDDYWHYFTKEPRYREEGEIWEPLFRHHASQVSAGEPFLQTYDAGLLGEGGGGDVSWWHDYIRAELERAHEFYADQFSALAHTPADTDAAQSTTERLARALEKVEATLEAYADPTGYTDNYGEQLPADTEMHEGLAAAAALVDVRAALVAYRAKGQP